MRDSKATKEAILDAAQTQFLQKGYDRTSISGLLQVTGIARGTLYYHFKSKEDILDAVIDRFNGTVIQQVAAVLSDGSRPVLERFSAAILAMNRPVNPALMEEFHEPQNALLHQKVQDQLVKGLVPLFADLLKSGMDQGAFDTPYPESAVEMILVYALSVFDDRMDAQSRQARIPGFLHNAERLLGCAPGTIAHIFLQVL